METTGGVHCRNRKWRARSYVSGEQDVWCTLGRVLRDASKEAKVQPVPIEAGVLVAREEQEAWNGQKQWGVPWNVREG